jgi:hypothetical protein
MKKLIITSAYIDDQKRKEDYEKSFICARECKIFDEILIMETISDRVDYIENSGFQSYYSKLGNPSPNKGINWIKHIESLLVSYSDDDIIFSLSGRYMINESNNIQKMIEYIENGYDIVAKKDSDLFVGDGVHTFFVGFRKRKFIDFVKYHSERGLCSPCIEHDMKIFMEETDKCLILDGGFRMGIETNYYYNPEKKGIC